MGDISHGFRPLCYEVDNYRREIGRVLGRVRLQEATVQPESTLVNLRAPSLVSSDFAGTWHFRALSPGRDCRTGKGVGIYQRGRVKAVPGKSPEGDTNI